MSVYDYLSDKDSNKVQKQKPLLKKERKEAE